MNKPELEKLKNKIIEFQGKDIFIKLENSICYHTTIYNSKIILSNQKLIISDEKNQDFIVELFYLENISTDGNTVYLELSNDIKITLDY